MVSRSCQSINVLSVLWQSFSLFWPVCWKLDERLLENYIQLFWSSLLPSPPLCLEVLKSIIPFLTCHHNLKVNKILEGLKALPEIEYFDNYNKKYLYMYRYALWISTLFSNSISFCPLATLAATLMEGLRLYNSSQDLASATPRKKWEINIIISTM